jgi:hypothetical protein
MIWRVLARIVSFLLEAVFSYSGLSPATVTTAEYQFQEHHE